jgi:membrane protein
MWQILKLLWRFRKAVFAILLFTLGSRIAEEERGSRRGSEGHREEAGSPADISKTGWKAALKETKTALKDKDLSTTAAALAYYATLTFFPAVLGIASIYLLFSSPQQLENALHNLHFVVPTAIYMLLNQALSPLTHNQQSHALFAVIISVLALLWTTSGGLQNLVKATNKVYEVEETRSVVKRRLISVMLSVVLLVLSGFIIFLLILQGDALRHWGWPPVLATLFPILRWPVLVILITLVIAVIYRYAPNRDQPHWGWVSWGATAATIIWLAASALFFIYAQNFANFNRTYGAFAGIIVLMTWFNITSLIILLGGQVNKKLEAVVSTPKS